ncbi:MAG: hypothetical protein KDI48_02140 [Xanthomonadales bacterium]|nr:hypothetical protein [Xanthomonadales bacterium]
MQHVALPGSKTGLPTKPLRKLRRAAEALGEFTSPQLQRRSGVSLSMTRRFTDLHCRIDRYGGDRAWQRAPIYVLRDRCAQGSESPSALHQATSPGFLQPQADRAAPAPSTTGALRRAAVSANENAPVVAATEARNVTLPE